MARPAAEEDLSTLEGLDFDLTCQSVVTHLASGRILYVCDRPAEWAADVHQRTTHAWPAKLLCESCMTNIAAEPCHCGEVYRLRNVVKLSAN